MVEFWYRMYDGTAYSDGSLSFHLDEYQVVGRTPKGVWLHAPNENNGVHGDRKFVLHPIEGALERGADPGRRFAYPTKQHALFSYERRKLRQVQHLERQLEKASRLHAAVRDRKFEEYKGLYGTHFRLTDSRNDDFTFEEY